MAKLTKANEYGQLELNQVAFRRDGRIIAQYKIDAEIPYVENGMLLAVDHVNKTIKYPENDQVTGLALNYTTEHMYDERLAGGLKHFKLDNGTFLPRLGLLATGDRFTTNTVDCDIAAVKAGIKAGTAYYGHATTNGYITVNNTAEKAVLQVIEVTTMPDGQDAIKFVAL
jgi:hypothetical protein